VPDALLFTFVLVGKRIFVNVLRTIAIFIAGVSLYIVAALVLTLIPTNSSFDTSQDGIEIFVISNGKHTDICLPVVTKHINWLEVVDTSDFAPQIRIFTHIAFGWGDKGFYLETPTWADLKFSTAFKAIMLPTSTAMHVTYYEHTPIPSDLIRSVTITEQKYKKLVNFVRSTFELNENGKLVLIDCCRYPGFNDSFYEATSNFHLFKTCNVWTNQCLKIAGVKTAPWAPFDECVLYHL